MKHKYSIEDISLGSVWQNGPEWMRRDTVSMLLTRYDQLVVGKSVEDEVDLECFDEPFLLNALYVQKMNQNQAHCSLVRPGGMLALY